ncbi:uncharacterized protein Mid1 [Cloeon dipterum]|uniref:uncharacterized protein Mid1 n=1 Tax=Cloeon dipterum TaxID=197152 RepID=UPI0032206247
MPLHRRLLLLAASLLLLLTLVAGPADGAHPAGPPANRSASWWPLTLPQELLNSNMGTTQQQIIGVPPSWGLGCPTPGSMPPARDPRPPPQGKNATATANTSIDAAANQHDQPYHMCPRACMMETIRKNDSNPSTQSANTTNNGRESTSQHSPELSQCLHYLKPSVFETLCEKDYQSIYQFRDKVSNLRLPFCCEHSVESVLMAGLEEEYAADMRNQQQQNTIDKLENHNNTRSNENNKTEVPVSRLLRTFECNRHLEALLSLDRLARKATHLFDAVLQRYDCGQTYSVHFKCDDCKDAYRRWVCASLLPYHEPREPASTSAPSPATDNGKPVGQPERPNPSRRNAWRKVRPCRDVCQQVEQRCPFFLPGDRAPGYTTQYAGEPTFLCLDPNIPETGEQLERSSYGREDCCFRYCDTTDSIAHYQRTRANQSRNFDVCPTTACDTSAFSVQARSTLLQAENSAATRTSRRVLLSTTAATTATSTSHSPHRHPPPSMLLAPEPLSLKSHHSWKQAPQHQHSSSQQQLQPRQNKNEVVVVDTRRGQDEVPSSDSDNAGRHVRDAAGDSAANRGGGVRTPSFHIHSWTIRQVRRASGGATVALPLASDPTTNIFSDNRLPVLWRRWWSSIFTKIFATAELIAALLPYVLLFLLVQKRAVEGYL